MTDPLSEEEIARRLPLWVALSDLFLDTDTRSSAPYIARTIVEQGYALAEAEDILRWEVRPAFWRSLLAIAGEWRGWPDDHVRERVLAARDRRLDRLLIGRDRFMPRAEWAAVAAEVKRLREG